MMETLEQGRVKMADNGRIVIPVEMREAMGFKAGDTLILIAQEDGLRITTMQQQMERAQELFAKYDTGTGSMADELIADRRREAARELEQIS